MCYVKLWNTLSSLTSWTILTSSHYSPHFQHGFRKGFSCETQLVQTIHDFAKNYDQKLQTDLILLDFSKAFDSVPHQRLLYKLSTYGIPDYTLLWIKDFLSNRTQVTVVDGHSSQSCSVTSGVPQGSVLGPLLFLLYINDLPHDITASIRLFADDCIMYLGLSSMESPQLLQDDLNTLSKWAETWQMRFNSDKCFVMHLSRSKTPVRTTYFLGSTALKETASHSYLGITLSSDLRFNEHCDNTTKKAGKMLNFISRNFYHCTRDVKSKLYLSLVRPLMEYAVAAWDPYTQRNINALEKVQRRAARFAFRDYSRDSSVNQMLTELQWPLLADRRENHRLSFMFKATRGLISIALNNYITIAGRTTRHKHNLHFDHLYARTDVYKYSFFPRTIPAWNRLSRDIIDSGSLMTFKNKLE